MDMYGLCVGIVSRFTLGSDVRAVVVVGGEKCTLGSEVGSGGVTSGEGVCGSNPGGTRGAGQSFGMLGAGLVALAKMSVSWWSVTRLLSLMAEIGAANDGLQRA
jgi:hypothetical protein